MRQPKPVTERGLTSGEIGMARKVFGSAVQYGRVKVHKGRFLPGSGDNAMTPFGEMHFPDVGYRDDFSLAGDASKIWFMHEMVHVWQYQLGRCVMCQGAILAMKGGYGEDASAYDYSPALDKGKKFSSFNMEQQGDLIAHYFDASFLPGNPTDSHQQHVAMLPFYESVLADFLSDPSNASLLPNSTRAHR
jgi:hypothetical protein